MNALTIKLVAIGAMILFLLIPANMIDHTVQERRGRRDGAVADIHTAWSRRQVLSGPVLTVPVRVLTGHDKAGKPLYAHYDARFTPETLDVAGSARTQTRRRGIYKTAVYTADLALSGRFEPPDFGALNLGGLGQPEPLWERARVAFGVSDLRGIKESASLEWGGKSLPLEPGHAGVRLLGHGVETAVPADALRAGKAVAYRLPLALRGSEGLSFAPYGRTTTVAVESAWPSPSFFGSFLPDTRSVGKDGFKAGWKVLHINRSLPAAWVGDPQLEESAFGVNLLIPVDHYGSVQRSTKYAVLFIFLTFLAFFLTEFAGDRRLHPVQYLMIGCALVLFYLLELSLSEHLPFGAAYALSSAAVVALLGAYSKALFGGGVAASVAAGACGLYAFLYVLLRAEDYALLLGSFGLLFALGAVMYATRRVDWYGAEAAKG
jgi:inner membrane protein